MVGGHRGLREHGTTNALPCPRWSPCPPFGCLAAARHELRCRPQSFSFGMWLERSRARARLSRLGEQCSALSQIPRGLRVNLLPFTAAGALVRTDFGTPKPPETGRPSAHPVPASLHAEM